MAGFRDFQTGEVLTAANVNDFLAKQSVMKFADATARDTALGTAVGGGNALREGMVAYLDSTDEVLFYDGAAWGAVGLPLGTATPTDGQVLAFGTATSTWNPTDGGVIIAVKHALFTGTQTASVAAGAGTAVTDLSITHAMSSASNQLIISAYFGVAASSHDPASVGLAVADGATLIGVGNAAGDRTQVGAGGWQQGAGVTSSDIVVARMSVMFVYEPGDTASHTYTVRALNVVDTTRTLYIGRTQDDTDFEYNPRGASGFVIQEVKV